MNSVFGYQIQPENRSGNVVFEGARLVGVFEPNGSVDPQLRIFVSSEAQLKSVYVADIRAYAHIWGIPVHPDIQHSDIPVRCARAVSEKRFDWFKELIGTFVVIVDEPLHHRITFVTDILGVRPMFLGKRRDHIVFGSEVWPLHRAGLTQGKIDYDAVSAWVTYGYNCTQGSLFEDLRRLTPGSAVVLENGRFNELSYADLTTRSDSSSPERIADELHEVVASTLKTLLTNFSPVSLALSGGFDSRYLAALAAMFLPKSSIECATVAVGTGETTAAANVAQAVGLSQTVFPVASSEWDIHSEVYHFMADGFPISKSVTDYVARRMPGIPMINGFMGDSLIRGSHDQIQGKYETEHTGDLIDVLQSQHQMLGPKILRGDIAARIQARARIPMEHAVRKAASGKLFAWVDYYYRQRHYISNNFLQHLDQTEALLPFYTWQLLSYKMAHDSRLFGRDIYRRIFGTHFPLLAAIPHASDIPEKRSGAPRIARCAKSWAWQLLPALGRKSWLSLVNRKRAAIVVAAGLAGNIRAENYIFTLKRLCLIEERARAAALDVDWEAI